MSGAETVFPGAQTAILPSCFATAPQPTTSASKVARSRIARRWFCVKTRRWVTITIRLRLRLKRPAASVYFWTRGVLTLSWINSLLSADWPDCVTDHVALWSEPFRVGCAGREGVMRFVKQILDSRPHTRHFVRRAASVEQVPHLIGVCDVVV